MSDIKIAVFDLGGTLMEYKGMHLSWISYYKGAFDYTRQKLGLELTDSQIEKSIKILSGYNPRVRPREKEIEPEVIFTDVTSDWHTEIPVAKIIDVFLSPSTLSLSFTKIQFHASAN